MEDFNCDKMIDRDRAVGQFTVTGCTQHATDLSVKDDVVCPKACSFATHSKVCTFSSLKDYILLSELEYRDRD